jgi:hypothetical protein
MSGHVVEPYSRPLAGRGPSFPNPKFSGNWPQQNSAAGTRSLVSSFWSRHVEGIGVNAMSGGN